MEQVRRGHAHAHTRACASHARSTFCPGVCMHACISSHLIAACISPHPLATTRLPLTPILLLCACVCVQLNIRIMRASHEAFSQATPQPARLLIKSMLVLDAVGRLQASQALEHWWYTGQAPAPSAAPPTVIASGTAGLASASAAASAASLASANAASLAPPSEPSTTTASAASLASTSSRIESELRRAAQEHEAMYRANFRE